MANRKDLSSWLEGTPQGNSKTQDERAEKLGIPATGPGSQAGLGRRSIALLIDWGAASAISLLFFKYDPMATLGVFAAAHFLFVSSVGFTLGHFICGIKVRPRHNESNFVGFVSGFLRTLLLCLVVPAVIWDSEGVGLHDRAANTLIVRK